MEVELNQTSVAKKDTVENKYKENTDLPPFP
jgi:hypothetical protein